MIKCFICDKGELVLQRNFHNERNTACWWHCKQCTLTIAYDDNKRFDEVVTKAIVEPIEKMRDRIEDLEDEKAESEYYAGHFGH